MSQATSKSDPFIAGIALATWVAIAGLLLVSIFGEGFVYNLWNTPKLTYRILDPYVTSGEVVGGLVVENIGQAPSANVKVSLDDIGTNIVDLNIPRGHGRVTVASGGEGFDSLILLIDSLPEQTSVTIYFSTEDIPLLNDEKQGTLSISDSRGLATRSTRARDFSRFLLPIAIVAAAIIVIVFLNFWSKLNRIARMLDLGTARQIQPDVAVGHRVEHQEENGSQGDEGI